jgi:hypothetical protein
MHKALKKHFQRLRKQITNLREIIHYSLCQRYSTAEELQSELNYFYEYCEKWNFKSKHKKIQRHGYFKGEVTDKFKF